MPEMTPRHCLVIDDDAIASVFLVDLLRAQGWRVARARSLATAREQLAAAQFDVILVDRHLPDGDGVRWLSEVLATAGRGWMPRCLVISGDRVETAMLPAGVGQLRKPVDAGHLCDWLANDPDPALPAADDPAPAAATGWASAGLLDDAGALARFGGNRDALQSLRAMLRAELDDSARWRLQLRQPMPPAAAIDALHRLRAACALTGCVRLGLVSEAVESDLRRGLAMPGGTLDEFDAIVATTIAAIAERASVDLVEDNSLRAQRSNPGS